MSFRFADLKPGTEFYLKNENTVYSAAFNFNGCWNGNSKKELSLNCEVFPVGNKVKLANEKLAGYRKLAKQFGLTYKELKDGYRNLVAKTTHKFQRDPISEPKDEFEEQLFKALRYCYLIHTVTNHWNRKTFEIVSGDNNRLYI